MNLRYRTLHKPTDWLWVLKQVHINESADNCGIVAIDTDTELPVAVLVLENVSSTSATVHFAVTDTMAFKHGFLEECADFLFCGLKLDHVYGFVSSDNPDALSVDLKLGFKEVYLMENAAGMGVHYHMLKMSKEDCKYLKGEENGR